jgi:hypothetical protein
MYVLMYDQIILLIKCLITYNTGVWPLPTMYELMSDQMILTKEFLITYMTGKTLHSTGYLNMFTHRTLMFCRYFWKWNGLWTFFLFDTNDLLNFYTNDLITISRWCVTFLTMQSGIVVPQIHTVHAFSQSGKCFFDSCLASLLALFVETGSNCWSHMMICVFMIM